MILGNDIRIRFHIVVIETANFSLRFHFASTRKRLETITSESCLQREQYEKYENDV